ncbi:MAG: Cache 3/Cache 2 fusion domain-containing protein [Deltaproteobacteria bacterium]|nr:Cache 3/Cache 2 fusion domain-containing protein [Deltaproteobacteria bacterium]MBW2303948.1 Cache 3/Cache 2 fusion domain-containing protein [Deltaproteobacteria bacterium]
MRKGSLHFKLVVAGVLLVLIPVALLGVLSVNKTTKALKEISGDRAIHIAKNLAEMTQILLTEEEKLAASLSRTNAVVKAVTELEEKGPEKAKEAVAVLDRELAAIKKRLGDQYETLSVTDSKGKVFSDGVGGSHKGIDISSRPYFQTAKIEGKVVISDPVKSKSSGKPVIPVCAPIFSSSGKFAGALITVLRIESLCDAITSHKVGKTGYPFMVDEKGLTIAHPNKENIFRLNVKEIPGMEDIAERMLNREVGIEGYQYKGQNKTAAFASIPITGWSIAVTQANEEFLGTASSIRNRIFLLGGGLLIAAVLGAIFFARSISRSIQRIIQGLSEGAEQMASAASQVSSASQSLAEASSEQAASLEETSSSLEEMSSMTKQNADHATEADNLMKEANSIVGKANGSMKDLIQAMEEITKSSEETSNIIRTIDEIAFQTNLLALNAAVEAARAGEAGAGFAVVADEVRNLAMRAAEAAKNTAILIEDTVKSIKDGSELVARTNEEFSQVSQSAAKVGELVGEIAAASTEQARGIEQINSAVAEMDKVVQQNAANAEESASASEEMSAQAEQMKAMVKELTALIQGSGKGTRRRKERFAKKAEPSMARKENQKQAQVLQKVSGGGESLPVSGGNREVRPEKVIPLNEDDFQDF